MMVMPLSEAAQVLDAKQWGADVTFHGISTDTRTLSEGNLFVALKGPNFDGHDYIEQARQHGAVAAAVSRKSSSRIPLPMRPPSCLGGSTLGSWVLEASSVS